MSEDDTPQDADEPDQGDAESADETNSPNGFDERPSEETQERSDPFGLDADLEDDEKGPQESTPSDPQADANEEGGANTDAPLGSIAASVDERRNRDTNRPDDGLFDQESVPEIDTDVVWEQLDEDDPGEVPDDHEQDVRVIEKRSYCEQCPYFAEPPEVSCSHEGTEILELVDMEQFRVVDCPKVREDERLEQL